MTDVKPVLKKFIKEKFHGMEPNWRDATWGDVSVLCTQDSHNWYYKKGSAIYTQSKDGDVTPHCYGCGTEIQFKEKRHSVWFKEFSGPVGGGEVRVKHIPYCPTCEIEPDDHGVIIE